MAQKQSEAPTEDRPQPLFVTTRWSVVLAARDKASPDAAQALEYALPHVLVSPVCVCPQFGLASV